MKYNAVQYPRAISKRKITARDLDRHEVGVLASCTLTLLWPVVYVSFIILILGLLA